MEHFVVSTCTAVVVFRVLFTTTWLLLSNTAPSGFHKGFFLGEGGNVDAPCMHQCTYQISRTFSTYKGQETSESDIIHQHYNYAPIVALEAIMTSYSGEGETLTGGGGNPSVPPVNQQQISLIMCYMDI